MGNHSPIVSKTPSTALAPATDGADFSQAVKSLLDGAAITKLEWGEPRRYGVLHNGRLCIYKPETNQLHPWILTDGDLTGTDWVTISPA